MGFNGGILLSHLTPNHVYKYPLIRDKKDISNFKKFFQILESSNKPFIEMDVKQQAEIINTVREISNNNCLRGSFYLADYLFERIEQVEESQGIKDIKECLKLYIKLIKSGSPDGYYGYYAIYKFVKDKDKLSYTSLSTKDLMIYEEMVIKSLNNAIKMGHRQALFDLADTVSGTGLAVDVCITIGYLYQDREGFYQGMKHANCGIDN